MSLPDDDLIEIPLIDSWARIRELEAELADAREIIDELQEAQSPLWRQIGRLRSACEAALTDLNADDLRPNTIPRLEEALE